MIGRILLAALCSSSALTAGPGWAQHLGRAGSPSPLAGARSHAAWSYRRAAPAAPVVVTPPIAVPSAPAYHGPSARCYGDSDYGCAPFGYGGFADQWGGFDVAVGGVGSFTYYHGPVGSPAPWWALDPYTVGHRMNYYTGPIGLGYTYGPPASGIDPLWHDGLAGIGAAGQPGPEAVLDRGPIPPPNLPAPAAQPQGRPSALLMARPSSAAAKLKSVRAQSEGDGWFRKQEYHKAYERYKAAISAAGDRSEPRIRLAVVFAALGHFGPAVREWKLGLQRDPDWPARHEDLDELFGEGNDLAKSSVLNRVTGWAREDIRDPDRLFLIGALLEYDNDDARATPFFEAAWKLAGAGEHLVAFLKPRDGAAVHGADAAAFVEGEGPVAVPRADGRELRERAAYGVEGGEAPIPPAEAGPVLPPLPMP